MNVLFDLSMKHRKVLLLVLKKVLSILEGWFCGGRETEKKNSEQEREQQATTKRQLTH